jgi:Pyruvate/2-oxoacid:ferredoxin oxidoreductase delta subunit
MEVNRKIIEIDDELCNGCGECVPSCAEGALQIVDGKALLVADLYCDGLGACLGECPTGALTIVEREADEFDEEAVEEYLHSIAPEEKQAEETLPCGCPSTQLKSFIEPAPSQGAEKPGVQPSAPSELAHWPVQIKLVPPTAPFLKGADLLVAADCTPVAYPNFHRDFLKGKAVMVGCPKFDDAQEYIQKFADIFGTADIKSVTVVVMEVPCCQGLPVIVEKGMEMSGKKIPIEKAIISARGDLLGSERLAA